MLRTVALVLSVATLACGDNTHAVGEPLAPAATLVVVAHQNDELLFMQPDLAAAAAAGGLTTVYVTAGDDGLGVAHATERDDGVRAAYAAATGASVGDWVCGAITIADHAAQHCRLDAQHISLVFLAYPDGGQLGDRAGSLLALWQGTIDGADTIAQPAAHYDQAGLIATVAALITTTQPTVIRTLEIAATHGTDHSDHMLVGALAMLGAAAAGTTAEIVSYRGTNTAGEPANQLAPVTARATAMLAAYDAACSGCTGSDGSVGRQYAVSIRRTPLTGALTDGTHCAVADADGTITLATCDPIAPPQWTFAANGTVQLDATRCLQVLPTGELGAGDCAAGYARWFRIDDDGHVWVGNPPVPVAAMDYAHLQCLIPSGGKVRAALCGETLAPVWAIWRPLVTTTRAAAGLTAAGRAVQLGDVDGDHHADLCTVVAGELMCAPGDGHGGFGAAVAVAPLAIDPASLVIGAGDACGRSGAGIACVTAASSVAAFAVDDATLAIADGALCGLTATGVQCAGGPVLSSFPPAGTPVWIGDLDGDHAPDWCESTAAGPACGLAADAALTTGGAAWGYSLAAVVEGSLVEGTVVDDTSAALADVTGDGRVDLCTLFGNQVGCAPSLGRDFGPRHDMLELPGGATASSLWLGDLDGDGKADVCVADATTITCRLSP